VRFYSIKLTNHETGKPLTIPSLAGSGMPPGVITSQLPDGTINPGALNIEMDLVQTPGHIGDTSSYLRIWGLSLQELAQSFNLNPTPQAAATTDITISGGMAKGYPLANPAQQGLLVKGSVLQAFGNWVGTDMTLDIYLQPPTGTAANPVNFTFTWAKGEALSVMIARVLKQVLPSAAQSITINASRIANQEKIGAYQTFTQFAQAVREFTAGGLSATDPGVYMAFNGQTVVVCEGAPTSSSTGTKQIVFQDLLGQVTWSAPNQITAKLVMRGDLNIGDQIQFPAGLLTSTTAPAMSQFSGTGAKNPSNSLTFGKNLFNIQHIQHWGNFRQPDATCWNTMVIASLVTPPDTSPAPTTPTDPQFSQRAN
jgi:hypothetical protein